MPNSNLFRILLVLALYFLFLFFGLPSFPLIDWDENIYGAVAKSMFQTKEFFRLQVNGELYIEKPPFYFWLISICYSLFGISEFATRFPSVLSGIVSFLLLFWFGKRIHSASFGLLWAMVYSSSLLPLGLSRTAYIDHWFNTFLLGGFISFYFYETAIDLPLAKRIRWIFAGSLCMGFGVLTKGPIAVVLPLSAYLFVKFITKKRSIPIFDFFVGLLATFGVISLYYLPNFLLYGADSLWGFVGFQGKLFSQSLESHTGPFFYHFYISLLGFFPWSPLLFVWLLPALRNKLKISLSMPLTFLFLFWIGFILILFSFVQTKLPHYSSSLYIPFSYFVVHSLVELQHSKEMQKYWRGVFFYSLLFSIFFIALPFLFQEVLESNRYQKQFGVFTEFRFGLFESIPGVLLFLGTVIGFLGMGKAKESNPWVPVVSLWLSVQFFLSSFCFLVLPKTLYLLQNKNLTLVDRGLRDGTVAFYKYLTFYPMFYRESIFPVIGSYKFQDRTDLLQKPPISPLFLLTLPKYMLELSLIFPDRNFQEVGRDGDLILLLVR